MDTRTAEMLAGLERAGMVPRLWRCVSTFGGSTTRRAAYHVELCDGRAVKARMLRDKAAAERVLRLHRALGDVSLSPVLASAGRLLVEGWVDGEPLADDVGSVRDAATLLARIHCVEHPAWSGTRSRRATRLLLETGRARVWRLARQGIVGARRRAHLLSILERTDPGEAVTGIIHGDFCAENLVRASSGRLVAIDNEELSGGFLDYDLGLTWYRWPLPEDRFAVFLEAYAHEAARTPGDLSFWKVVAVLKGLTVRARFDPDSLPIALHRLRDLAGEPMA